MKWVNYYTLKHLGRYDYPWDDEVLNILKRVRFFRWIRPFFLVLYEGYVIYLFLTYIISFKRFFVLELAWLFLYLLYKAFMKQWVIKTLKNKDEQTILDVLLYFYYPIFFLMTKQDCLLYLVMLNALMQKIIFLDDCLMLIQFNQLNEQ